MLLVKSGSIIAYIFIYEEIITLGGIIMDREHLRNSGFATKAIHGGNKKDQYGSLATPIHQTATFIFDSAEQGGRRFAGEEDGYIYTRLGNPTNTVLEEKLAMLEGGEACMSMASGIGAISSAMWTALKAGDHVVCSTNYLWMYSCIFGSWYF